MSRRLIVSAVILAALAIPTSVLAHEGHVHKIMGTVSMHHENHLEVKATDGKTSTITLNEKPKIVQGTAKATPEDIKAGDRVVVSATETKGQDGKLVLVASEVRLGAAATTAKTSKK